MTRNKQAKSLRAQIRDMKEQLGMREAEEHPQTEEQRLAQEIEQLEKKIAYMYMDDEELLEEEPVIEEDVLVDEDLDEDLDDDDDVLEEMLYMSSEDDPAGVEEDITQDYLNDVAEEVGAEGLATAPSMWSVGEKKARLVEASQRLDRVADYLEKNNQKKLAYRLDVLADMVDQKLASMEDED